MGSVSEIYSRGVGWLVMESHPQVFVHCPDHRDRERELLIAKPWYRGDGVLVTRTDCGVVSRPNNRIHNVSCRQKCSYGQRIELWTGPLPLAAL